MQWLVISVPGAIYNPSLRLTNNTVASRSGGSEVPGSVGGETPEVTRNPYELARKGTITPSTYGLRVTRNNHPSPSLSLVPECFTRLWSRQTSDLFDNDRSPYTLRLTREWRDLPERS